ncbi:MAG: capsule biosynthesis protein [Rhodobacterales bacterium]|nr:capsule biosynthesis protein [Rhodobacterales bacterium]MDX5412727.1 capsule biosynthesis protein [Rhodobacterales bacterium]
MLVLASFVLMVVLPTLVAAWFLWVRAADQYASNLGFSVRREETSSALELLGGITALSGSSSTDTDILYKFLQSQDLVRRIHTQLDLAAIWSHPAAANDFVFGYDTEGTIEDLLSHWKRMVKIYYDSASGLIDLRVLSFDPQDSRRIAEAIFAESTAMINELSAIAREDAIRYARADLESAVERLKTARQVITEYRNRTQIVDPTMDTQGQIGLVNTLQGQLAEAMIELDLLSETTRSTDPRIETANRRIRVIEARIAAERQKVGIGTASGNGEAFADLVGEYERLVVDREFAEQSYTASLAAYDAALAEARRQSRYLAAHIRPTLAERAEYPERFILLAVTGLFLFLIWSVVVLVAYSLRDRR